MLYTCYLRDGVVYVPTVGLRGAVYTIMEPVSVVPVASTEGLREAFHAAVARSNVPVPAVKGNWPPPVLPKYAGLKTWSAFARGTSTWNIEEYNGRYQIKGHLARGKGHWEEDPNQRLEFSPGTSVDDVIERMIGILQNAALQNAANAVSED